MYHIINKINGCIEESNENKYFTVVPSDKSKDILKNMKNYGTESELTSNNSRDYDKKYIKTKFNSHNNLPLKKTLELYNMVIVFRSFFHKGNKY